MDALAFLNTVTPAKRSHLAPFWNDVVMLRNSGCSLKQVCAFLAVNNVTMSVAGLSKYIKRQEVRRGVAAAAAVTPLVPVVTPTATVPTLDLVASGGMTRTERVLATPSPHFSFKQQQKLEKDQK